MVAVVILSKIKDSMSFVIECWKQCWWVESEVMKPHPQPRLLKPIKSPANGGCFKGRVQVISPPAKKSR